MSEMSREVREDSDSLEERSSKTRSRALTTCTDVNKLRTPKDTNISLLFTLNC